MLRRYGAEFLGTFAIVFFGAGAIATFGPDGGAGARLAVNGVFGLTVAAMIYALGHLSAAHFNPAVTLGFAVARRFPWHFVLPYWAAQCGGAVLASLFHRLLLPDSAAKVQFGATTSTLPVGAVLGVEAVLTFFLMLVIISVATDRRVSEAIPGLAIGATVALCGLFGGPLSGCSMNPARSLGPALLAGGSALAQLWVYAAGPMLGAVAGALCYEALRGGEEHAQGAPNDLYQALKSINQPTA